MAQLGLLDEPAVRTEAGEFSRWIRRPDYHGRMGWEPPGLPESARWWARCDFEDLLRGPSAILRTARRREENRA